MKKHTTLNPKNDLNLFLVQLRKQRCLTQQEMADMLYISRPTYASWENCIDKIPLNKFILIVDLFNIPTDDVLRLLFNKKSPIKAVDESKSELVLRQLTELTERIKSLVVNN